MMSERATSCAMLAEVKPFEKRDALKDARILVWFKNRDAQAAPEMLASIEKRHLRVLSETDMAFVLENPQGYSQSVVPKPLVPTAALFGLFGLSFLALYSVIKKPLF